MCVRDVCNLKLEKYMINDSNKKKKKDSKFLLTRKSFKKIMVTLSAVTLKRGV